MTKEVPDLDIFVDFQNPIEGLKEVIKVLRPEWNIDKVTYDDKSTGYINKNMKVYVPGNNEAVFVRVVLSGLPDHFLQNQKLVHAFMDEVKLGPQLLCYLKNGMCVEFLQGDFMTWDTRKGIYSDKVWPLTAKHLALYHSKSMYEKAKNYGIRDKVVNFEERDRMLFSKPIDRVKYSNPESDFCKAIPSGEEALDARDWFVRTCTNYGLDKCFVHLDANPTNWLIRGDKTICIDYDATCINFRTLCISWFFLLHADYRDMDLNEYPSEEYRMKWLRQYLTSLREYDQDPRPVTDQDVKKLQADVDIGLLGAHLQAVFSSLLIMVMNQKTGEMAVQPRTTLDNWAAFKRKRAELEAQGYK